MPIVQRLLHWRPSSPAVAVRLGIAIACAVGVVGTVAVRHLTRPRGGAIDGRLIALSTQRCATDCSAIDHDEGCDAFCACQVKALAARTKPDDLAREWSKKSAQDYSPEFVRQIQRTTAECGADMIDRRFMHSCVVGCGRASQICLETCECILDNLRGKGDRTESTLKLVEQESLPSNPQAEPRMQEILGKCQGDLVPDSR